MNAWIEQYLRPWTSQRQNNWAKLLPVTEFAHNSWKSDTTRKSPHKLLIGIKPQVNVKLIDKNVPAALKQLQLLEESRKEVQTWLEQLQKSKDVKVPMEMKVGDKVWLEGKNLSVTGSWELLPRRYGPFAIKQWIGQVAYKLELPSRMKIHDVFHIDLLMPYKEMEAYGTPYTRPPPVIEEGKEEYEIESIIDSRRHGRGRKWQYLVHWKGYPNSNNSWVNHKDLHAPELLKEYLSHSTTARWPNV